MSRMSALQAARENSMFLLRWTLEDVDRGVFGDGAFFSITRAYRRLAIGALLAEADLEAFRLLLAKSAQAYVHFLSLIQQGYSFDPKYFLTSKADAFSDALAAGDFDAARSIAMLSPSSPFPDLEYEDDFLRNYVLHRIFLDPDDRAGIEPLFVRWEEVLEGDSSVFHAILRALFDRAPDAFEEALDRLIERRGEVLVEWRAMATHDPEIDATEGMIFVEALAILRIAEMLGLPTRPDYRFAPDLARIPPGLPLPPPDAWRSP